MLNGRGTGSDTSKILQFYVSRHEQGGSFDVLGADGDIVLAFAWRASQLTFETLKHRDDDKRSWNSLLIDFNRLSLAHSQYLIVKNFYEAVKSPELIKAVGEETSSILDKLFRLFALTILDREAADFFAAGAVTVKQIGLARNRIIPKLLDEIRPNAVRLVDVWKFTDYQLDSSLGRYDGNVYPDLFKRASEQNPVNDLVFDPYPWNPNPLKEDISKSKL